MSVHATIDGTLARLTLPFAQLYADGFGEDLDARVEAVRDYRGPAPTVDIAWGSARTLLGVRVRRGTFRSPAAAYLPRESRDAVVEQWLPAGARAQCLILATTAEEFLVRRRPLAAWLARHRIGSVLLENPFYGERRPAGQRGPALRTVATQFAMNLATVEEAASLLRTLHLDGWEVGATGYSQGGVMSAFGAAVSDFPVAVVPRGAARAAAPIFTEGVLTRAIRWRTLAREAGSRGAAEARFREALEPVRVDRYPAPHDPSRAILVASRHDGFIPPEEAEALHAHWPGSELRWVEGGHLTGLVLHHQVHRRALLDAFGR